MKVVSVWDVVRVPFPYADRPTREVRPALVVAMPEALAAQPAVVWVLMITSAENAAWPGDVIVQAGARSGLPIRSRVRTAKVATVDARQVERTGTIGTAERRAVTKALGPLLAEVLT